MERLPCLYTCSDLTGLVTVLVSIGTVSCGLVCISTPLRCLNQRLFVALSSPCRCPSDNVGIPYIGLSLTTFNDVTLVCFLTPNVV